MKSLTFTNVVQQPDGNCDGFAYADIGDDSMYFPNNLRITTTVSPVNGVNVISITAAEVMELMDFLLNHPDHISFFSADQKKELKTLLRKAS